MAQPSQMSFVQDGLHIWCFSPFSHRLFHSYVIFPYNLFIKFSFAIRDELILIVLDLLWSKSKFLKCITELQEPQNRMCTNPFTLLNITHACKHWTGLPNSCSHFFIPTPTCSSVWQINTRSCCTACLTRYNRSKPTISLCRTFMAHNTSDK